MEKIKKSEIQVSLDASMKEGLFAQVMLILVDYFMIPYVLFLGGSIKQVGFMVAISQLLAALAQFLAPPLLRWSGNRLRLVLIGMMLQVIFLLPICFLPLLDVRWAIVLFIVLISIHRVLGTLIGPLWGSIVSQYLPENQRGEFFGRRARNISLVSVIAVISGGLLLYIFKKYSLSMGFALLFFIASLFRFLSFLTMRRHVELPLNKSSSEEFTFWMFLKRIRESNFVKFVLFISFMTFATHLSAPFFSVFMLRDLHLSYLQYMSVHLMTMVAGMVSFSVWGRHADFVGNASILKLTGYVIPFIPLLWILSTNIFFLVCVEFIAGFIWGGFNLCALNFIYDAVVPEKRVRVLSYFNFINGMAIFLGALLGGAIANSLPAIRGYSVYTLFVISSLLRFIPAFLFSNFFNEVRTSRMRVSKTHLIYSVFGIRPIIGRNVDFNVIPTGK